MASKAKTSGSTDPTQPGTAKTESAQKHPAAGDAQIRITLERLYAAWSDLDPAKAALFYAKDPDLTFFDVAPMKYTGWSEYAAGLPKAYAVYQSARFGVRRCFLLMLASLRYLDTFKKVDGSWLFAERLLYVDWVEQREMS